MARRLVTPTDIANRLRWIDRIGQVGSEFSADADHLEQELADDIRNHGGTALIGHLRLCGAIPEAYAYDSSAEKLYAKYTDLVIHEAFKSIGLTSVVLSERTGTADVECECESYSFVADAKAFRMSRTAKNQKDFKVQALNDWKFGKHYAMIVCPVYQLPSRTSQIYQQAIARSVCVFTYTHLACLVRYAERVGAAASTRLLQDVFSSIEKMLPTKSANDYWHAVNGVLLRRSSMTDFWREEKIALLESVEVAREDALSVLAEERRRVMSLSRQEAIQEVLKGRRLDTRVRAVESVTANGLLDLGAVR